MNEVLGLLNKSNVHQPKMFSCPTCYSEFQNIYCRLEAQLLCFTLETNGHEIHLICSVNIPSKVLGSQLSTKSWQVGSLSPDFLVSGGPVFYQAKPLGIYTSQIQCTTQMFLDQIPHKTAISQIFSIRPQRMLKLQKKKNEVTVSTVQPSSMDHLA